MQSFANNLLSLWGGASELEPSAVDLNAVITGCVKELSQRYELTHSVNILLPVSHVVITAYSFAVQLINLIKNAIVHGEGCIEVKLTQQKLSISNHIKHVNSKANDSVGMGIFIIEQDMECLGWHYHVNHDVMHEVEIMFSQ
jgi:signal transduction histidine kinase